MSLTATAPSGEFDALTSAWVSAVSSIENQQRSTFWAANKRVDTAGVAALEIDARDLFAEGGPLDPLDVVKSLTGTWDIGLSVSDTTAGFGLLILATMYQGDASGRANRIPSHNLGFPATYEYGGTPVNATGYAVFSDKEVTVSAAQYSIGTDAYEIDAEFRAGWNVAHWSSTDEGVYRFIAQPLPVDTELAVSRRTVTLGAGSNQDVYGFSMFPEHELGEASPYYFFSNYRSTPVPSIYARSWVGFHVTDNELVQFGDAYPGLFTSAGVTVNPPEARGMVLAVYAFDEATAGNTGWATDLGSALGKVAFANADGHEVWFVYADQDITIHVDVVDAASAPIRTVSGGAGMLAGWNRFDLVPDGSGYLLTRVPFSSADWSIVP